MKAYKNVTIEILEFNEDVITTSDPQNAAEQFNGYDDTIGAFGL